jgi:hypothetical protein
MADPVIDYSLMTPIMQPIQGFSIDWNALGNSLPATSPIGTASASPSTTTPTSYTYPSLSDLSNPGIDRYNQVMDYYATHPQPYTPMMTGLNQFVGGKIVDDLYNSLEYESDPRYAAALSSYNTLTGGDPNYYQSVSDIGGMQQLNDANRAMADARWDYTRAVLNEGVLEGAPSSESYMPQYLDKEPIPVGMVGDTTIYAHGATPGEGHYYLNKEGTGIEYFEPDTMSPLETAFVLGVPTLMGAIAGGPFGAAALGGAVGSATGSLMSDSMNEQPLDWGKAGITGVATYAGGAIAPTVTSAVTPALTSLAGQSVGQVAGGVVGGAAGGAVTGGIRGADAAYKTGSWDPVLYGAGIGGLVGGVTGGIQAYGNLNTPENLAYEYATANPGEQIYTQSPTQAMADEAYFYAQTHPGTWVDAETGQIHPYYGVGTPDSMYPLTPSGNIPYAPANPSSMYPLDSYGNIQYAPAAPEVAYPLGSNAEKLNAINAEPQFASDYIHPYNLGSGHGADVEIGSTNYDPYNTYFKEDPSIMSQIGKALLNKGLIDNLLKLLSGGGTSGGGAYPTSEEGRPGMGTSEAVTEFLMQHGGTGKGKSKGLGAGEVKGPYYGDSFMPGLREIKKYDEQGLYYT